MLLGLFFVFCLVASTAELRNVACDVSVSQFTSSYCEPSIQQSSVASVTLSTASIGMFNFVSL